MRNTGIKYKSGEQTPIINLSFAELLPPLPDEQYQKLEQDILQNGCYCPIILNEDMEIVDGHHRHGLCEKHGIAYEMVVFSFEDVLEAQQWALETQKARRNLSAWELGQIALKLKPAIEEKGKIKISENGGDRRSEDAISAFQISEKPIDQPKINTTKELAQTAGISHDTMNKVIQIDEHAPTPIKEALSSGELSVNQGYNLTKQLKDVPEEEREQAAERALEMGKARKEMQKADAETDRQSKISKQFCTAFEKAILLEPTAENVRIWVSCSRMTGEEAKDMAADATEIAEIFTTIAKLLEGRDEEKTEEGIQA